MTNVARTSREKLAAADAIAERLANRNQDETVWRSSEPLQRIADAFRAQVAAELEVAAAVKGARKAGFSWSAIGMMLGVSKQTAQHRFGKADVEDVA
jgi:hypothetical protein